MSKITIGRVGRSKQLSVNVRIDRKSVLGNPYPITIDDSRDQVCDKYIPYLVKEIKNKKSPVYKEMVRLVEILRSGRDLELQCHCYPKRCHGDTIRKVLLKYI